MLRALSPDDTDTGGGTFPTTAPHDFCHPTLTLTAPHAATCNVILVPFVIRCCAEMEMAMFQLSHFIRRAPRGHCSGSAAASIAAQRRVRRTMPGGAPGQARRHTSEDGP
jgi:hypothetical protein